MEGIQSTSDPNPAEVQGWQTYHQLNQGTTTYGF